MMNKGFWGKLKKPFFALAPMLDITDSPFRQIIAECGKPDVFCAWFISVDGLCSPGKDNILCRPNLEITKKERPIVVQLFGKDPEKFEKSASIMAELGFDGIDINFGCPDKDVLKQGAGAAIIKDVKLAKEIIRATKKGAGRIPVSVKTRIGFYKKNEMEDWILELLKEELAAICVHARTCKQGYGGEADWNVIKKITDIAKGSGALIIGNGDIKSREEGVVKAEESGADGVMIGRAILGNPWIFNEQNLNPCQFDCCSAMTGNFRIAPPKNQVAMKKCLNFSENRKEISKGEKLKMLVRHAELFEKYYKDIKNFNNFKKYLRSYVSGFDGSKELRMKLMEAKNSEEIQKIINL